ncbi:MAG: hypothetical protein JXR64_14080, partial [Spirochaetales bacterium]|nr:hypothetical protein [Spirochaetales bacterium]
MKKDKRKTMKFIVWLTIFAILPASIFSTYLYKEHKRHTLYKDTIDFFYEHREEFEKAIELCNEFDAHGITSDYDSSLANRIKKCGDYYIYLRKDADNTESNYIAEELSELLRVLGKNELDSVTSFYSYNQEHIDTYIFFYKGFFKNTSVFVVYTGYSSSISIDYGIIEPDRLTTIDDNWVILEKEFE